MSDNGEPIKVHTNNETKAEEPAPQDDSTQQTPKPRKRRFNIWSIFWGIVFVSIGVLLLLGNLDLLNVDWSSVWRLWPVVIIIAGFSILASTHWIWRVLSAITILLTLAALAWFATGHTAPNERTHIDQVAIQANTAVTEGNVDINAGASKLSITSHMQGALVDAKLESTGLTLDKQESVTGTVQKVTLSAVTKDNWWRASRRNIWDISVSEQLPLTMVIKAGASETTADLTNTKLRSLDINAGASSLDMTLGAKEPKQTVSIDSGASTITLRVPKESGVSLTLHGGLNSKNLADLKSINEDTYQSPNFATAKQQIAITADAGVANFTIVRY